MKGPQIAMDHRGNHVATISDGETEPSGDVRWHLMPEDSLNFKLAMGSYPIDSKIVRDLLERYVKQFVLCRLKREDYEGIISKAIDRKIEVAVNESVRMLDQQVRASIVKQIDARVAAEVAKVPIRVSVTAG